MGSWAHSTIQSILAGLINKEGRFNAPVELSLDVSSIDLSQFGIAEKEIEPDICLYTKKKRVEKGSDLVRMSEMPEVAIEILSPEQSITELSKKKLTYFALGVKSFWLVIPDNETITVYSAPNKFTTFDTKDAEVIDEVMDIRLPIKEIFEL